MPVTEVIGNITGQTARRQEQELDRLAFRLWQPGSCLAIAAEQAPADLDEETVGAHSNCL